MWCQNVTLTAHVALSSSKRVEQLFPQVLAVHPRNIAQRTPSRSCCAVHAKHHDRIVSSNRRGVKTYVNSARCVELVKTASSSFSPKYTGPIRENRTRARAEQNQRAVRGPRSRAPCALYTTHAHAVAHPRPSRRFVTGARSERDGFQAHSASIAQVRITPLFFGRVKGVSGHAYWGV